jgi:hypothetical protein
MISLMVLAGIAVLSCTDGTFEGTGGGGNLNIVDLPGDYNGKYCEVSVTGQGLESPLTFGSSAQRIQIKDKAVKAPLYTSAGEKYTGSQNLTVTVDLYDEVIGGTSNIKKTYNDVKFYSGSALFNWD